VSLSEIIETNEALLLFLVISIGVLLGRFKIQDKSLGVPVVLFVGLAFGYLNPKFEISEIILVLGLSMFIYSVGLNSGQIFFQSYKRNGMRDIVFSFAMIGLTAFAAVLAWYLLGFDAATISGIFAGISTNTPAFASVLDYIQNNNGGSEASSNLVVAYTLAYPIGILGSILGILIMDRLFKVDYNAEYKQLRKEFPLDNDLTSEGVIITNKEVVNIPTLDLLKGKNWNIKFGRIKKGDDLILSNWSTTFSIGDKVMVLGSKEDIDKAVEWLGEKMEDKLSYDRSTYDIRRIFLSNPKLAGRTIASLNIPEKFNGTISRIRRGDNDMLAHGSTTLELGDRIRVLAKREELQKMADYFGDSYQDSSRVNWFSFGFGLAIGLWLGTLSIPLWGDLTVRLGYAGGPLIVGLILGSLKRTGPILWTLPYSTSVVLQQLGVMFLLAYIGVNNGALFFQSLNVGSLTILGVSILLSVLSAMVLLTVGYKLVKIPFSLLMGMVSNQPSVIEFANEKVNSKLPQMGFALILPIAIIVKIIVTQILYFVLS
jgi:putative transport protein